MTLAYALLAAIAAWNLAPMLMLCALPIPARHKLRGSASLLRAAARGLLMLPADLIDADTWGDPATNRDHAGWCVRRNGPVYQLGIVRPIGAGLCLRVNSGHKLDLVRRWGRDVAMVVCITASVLRFKGEGGNG